jgi:hypothetical protein
MPTHPRILAAQHCFLADLQTLDVRNLSTMAHRGSLMLDDFGIGAVDLAFGDLPDCPPDFLEEGLYVHPTTDIARQSYSDAQGAHLFRLSRLKTSGVVVFAGLAENQIEDFPRRWYSFRMCDVFRLRKNIPADVDDRNLQKQTLDGMKMFLSNFCPLCRRAVAEGKEIYVLWEHHEYRAA